MPAAVGTTSRLVRRSNRIPRADSNDASVRDTAACETPSSMAAVFAR